MSQKSEKPRVLILSTAYFPLVGGSELAIKNITDRIPDLAFDLVTAQHDDEVPAIEQIGNVRVFRVGGWASRLTAGMPKFLLPLAMFFAARRLIQQHKYRLIHAFQASQAGGAAWLLKYWYPRLPMIVTLQEGKALDEQSFMVRFFRGLIVAKADAVSVISTYLERYARSVNPRTPIRLIPNGVAVEAFSMQANVERENIRATFGLKHDESMIVSVSRLVPKNGIANLMRAFKLVSKKNTARLVIVGDGPLRRDLERLADELGIKGRVIFVGQVSPDILAGYLGAADVFVRPSLSEGLGTAFLEAMACRVPVVASAVGGIPDFLINGRTGLFCDPYDPDDIAAAITKLASDPNLADTIREQAFALVKERYDWNSAARKTRELYGLFLPMS